MNLSVYIVSPLFSRAVCVATKECAQRLDYTPVRCNYAMTQYTQLGYTLLHQYSLYSIMYCARSRGKGARKFVSNRIKSSNNLSLAPSNISLVTRHSVTNLRNIKLYQRMNMANCTLRYHFFGWMKHHFNQ
jgi:hypothetical protein